MKKAVKHSVLILLCIFVNQIFAQNVRIPGKVLSDEGEGLSSTTITIEAISTGRKTHLISDTLGIFTLPLLSTNERYNLYFERVDYESESILNYSILSNENSSLLIRMKPLRNSLDEVVVVGYGTQKRKDVTGAISQVKPQDLSMVTTPSVAQMLAGAAAGVTVRQLSAQPGGGIEIYIRGKASTGAGNDPLWVVDGFPLSGGGAESGSGNRYDYGSRNPLNSINPYDIESIEILKDASATSIYGARAANGVVIVTTKKGKLGKPRVSYNFNQSYQEIAKKLEMLNATEFMQTANSYLYEKWLVDNHVFPYGNVDPAELPAFKPRYTDAQVAHAGEGTPWWDLVTRTGSIQQHNISMSGATELTKYLVSGNYFNQRGVVKNSDFKRYSVRTNIEQKISEVFSTGINLTLSQVDNKNSALGDNLWENSGALTNAIVFPPIYPVRDINGNYSANPDYGPMANPISMFEMTDNSTNRRILGTIFLEAQILEGLKARANVGIDNQFGKRQQYIPKTTYFGAMVNGDASQSSTERTDKLMNLTLNYTKRFAEKHNVDILAGYEYTVFDNEGYNAHTSGFDMEYLYYNLGAGNPQNNTLGSFRWPTEELASYFARFNYSFSDKYYLTVTGRRDGSSKFGKNNKWAFFPSAALKWRAIEEDFIKEINFLSDLQFRVSYGRAGNQNIGQNAFAYYSSGLNYIFGNAVNTGTVISQLENPNLKWETSSQLNAGIDFGFLKNRITGSVEYYHKIITDLLSGRALPSWYPVSSVADNIGSTQSKGIEYTMNTRNFVGEFKWTTLFNFAHFKDTWRNRNENVILNPWESPNDPIRPQWGYLGDGILQIGEEPPAYMPSLLPGQEKIKDINGLDENGKLTGKPDGKLTTADQVLFGTSDPSFTFGFGNTFEWKNFDLNIFLYGMLGRKAITDGNWARWGVDNINMITQGYNLMKGVTERWRHDNTDATMFSGMFNPYYRSNNGFWFNGNFARCRNITLGYTIQAVKKIFSSARVYADVQNPFIITEYPGMDPEFNNRAAYPAQRTYSLGVDINF